MDKVARLAIKDRRDVFSEAATKLGMSPAIVEKDFWVCLVLKTLFVQSSFKQNLVFKGGTSLSKVFGLIDRFSEDIDLVLDWKLIGFGEGLKDPMQGFDSASKQDRFNKEINRLAQVFIHENLRPHIDELVQKTGLGLTATMNPTDPHIVDVHYPAAFSESYLRPEVWLEVGPLASWVPSAGYTIRPYAFDVFPALFEDPACPVIAIAAERTFWEKATILHQQAHRSTLIPNHYSRHYYDLYKLALSSVRADAFAKMNLLRDVVRFKERFYPSKAARYDLANAGSFKLLPSNAKQITELERDYEGMQVMLFRKPPSFASILEALQQLEAEINALQPFTE